jgi:3-hydroxybutyryl-CoA dehydrogenase
MHFFNPPALMRLVEVVAGEASAEDALATVSGVAESMGRDPVRCADSPGFIVNRCNRPYTLESLRILDEGIATHAQIDRVLRQLGGYRMGPFELMDLIGIDVNLEVARSFYRRRPEPRWRPHPIQERMVAEGRLGRKSAQGFYEYGSGQAPPEAELPPEPRGREILERVVAQLVNEASFAGEEGVATPAEIGWSRSSTACARSRATDATTSRPRWGRAAVARADRAAVATPEPGPRPATEPCPRPQARSRRGSGTGRRSCSG